MSYRIDFLPEALDDLERIGESVRVRAGMAAADRRLDGIEAGIARLAELPHKGTRRDEVAPGLRSVPVGGSAVVVFVVDDSAREVLIVTVSFAGSEWQRRAAERLD